VRHTRQRGWCCLHMRVVHCRSSITYTNLSSIVFLPPNVFLVRHVITLQMTLDVSQAMVAIGRSRNWLFQPSRLSTVRKQGAQLLQWITVILRVVGWWIDCYDWFKSVTVGRTDGQKCDSNSGIIRHSRILSSLIPMQLASKTWSLGRNWVSDASPAYFHWISGNIVIVAKVNDKSNNFKCEFSYNYDIATYSVKIDV